MIWWLKNQYRKFKRTIQWIPVIWKDREFDHSYFLQILSFKLNQMEKFYRSMSAISADRKDCATKIHICKLLCDRLIADDYMDCLGLEFEDFNKTFQNCNIGISSDWLHYGDYMQKQDLKYLCEILQKHLFCWWD